MQSLVLGSKKGNFLRSDANALDTRYWTKSMKICGFADKIGKVLQGFLFSVISSTTKARRLRVAGCCWFFSRQVDVYIDYDRISAYKNTHKLIWMMMMKKYRARPSLRRQLTRLSRRRLLGWLTYRAFDCIGCIPRDSIRTNRSSEREY